MSETSSSSTPFPVLMDSQDIHSAETPSGLPQLCCSWVAHKSCKFASPRVSSDLPCGATHSKHAICTWRVRVSTMVEKGIVP